MKCVHGSSRVLASGKQLANFEKFEMISSKCRFLEVKLENVAADKVLHSSFALKLWIVFALARTVRSADQILGHLSKQSVADTERRLETRS